MNARERLNRLNRLSDAERLRLLVYLDGWVPEKVDGAIVWLFGDAESLTREKTTTGQ